MDAPQTEVFRFSNVLIGAVFAGAVLCFVAGLWLRRLKSYKRYGFALILVGLLGGLLMVPGLVEDHITVTAHDYSARTGFWFAPTERRFEFKDVEFITDGFWTDAKGRQNKRWEVHLKSGSIIDVPAREIFGGRTKNALFNFFRNEAYDFNSGTIANLNPPRRARRQRGREQADEALAKAATLLG